MVVIASVDGMLDYSCFVVVNCLNNDSCIG